MNQDHLNLMEIIFLYSKKKAWFTNSQKSKLFNILEKIAILILQEQKLRYKMFTIVLNTIHFDKSLIKDMHHFLISDKKTFISFVSSSHFRKFLLKIYSRNLLKEKRYKKKKAISNNILVPIFTQLIWINSILNNKFMKDPEVVKSFITSQNFSLLILIHSISEGVFYSKFSFLNDYTSQYRTHFFEAFFLEYSEMIQLLIIGLMQLKNPDHFNIIKDYLLKAILLTDFLCESFNDSLTKKLKNRNRLNINTKLYTNLQFISEFISFNLGNLKLKIKSYKLPKTKKISQRNKFHHFLLNKIIQNMIFYYQYLEKNTKNDFIENIYSKFNFENMYVILIKCLIRICPNFIYFINLTLEKILSQLCFDQFAEDYKLPFAKNLLHFFYLIYLDDTLPEQYFLSIGHDIKLKSKMFISREDAKELFSQTENLLKSVESFLSLPKEIEFKNFNNFFKLNIYNPIKEKNYSSFKNFLLESFCDYNLKNKKIKLKKKFMPLEKIMLYQNFFNFELEKIENIISDCNYNTKKPIITEYFFIPSYKKNDKNYNLFIAFFLNYFFVFFNRFEECILIRNKRKRRIKIENGIINNFEENIKLILNSIYTLVKTSSCKNLKDNILPDFVKKKLELYKEKPKILDFFKIFDNYFYEKDTPQQVKLPHICSKDKKEIKKLKQKILKRIIRKINPLKEKTKFVKPKPKCIICHEQFKDIKDSFLIANFVEQNNEKIILGKKEKKKGFRILKTCGHHYHYNCLNISNFYNGIKCHFCKQAGQIFMGGFSLIDKFSQTSFIKSNNTCGFEEMNEKMWIQLVILKEDPKGHPLSLVEKIIDPIINTIKMINTIKIDIFKRIFVPCLQRLMNFIYNLFFSKPEISKDIINSCKLLLHELDSPYKELIDLFKLRESFDISKEKYKICIEDYLLKKFIYLYIISIYEVIQKNSTSKIKKSINTIALKNLENVLSEILPWIIFFKKLQTYPDNGEKLSYSMMIKNYPDFMKLLNIFVCISIFDEIDISRKKTWKTYFGNFL